MLATVVKRFFTFLPILCFTFQLLELQLCRYHQLLKFLAKLFCCCPFLHQVVIIVVKQLMTLCRRVIQQKILLSKVLLFGTSIETKIRGRRIKGTQLSFDKFPFFQGAYGTFQSGVEHVQQCMREYSRILMMQHSLEYVRDTE